MAEFDDNRLGGAAGDGPARPFISRRNMLLGAALLGASAIGYARQPQPVTKPLPKDGLDKLIPKTIGPWSFLTVSGLVLPPDDNTDQVYDQVLTRMYAAPGQPTVALLLAYSSVQNGLLQLHRPEICYPASGFQLSSTEPGMLALPQRQIDIRRFSAASAQRQERVLYWTRLGSEMPQDWIDQRLAVVRANLRGEIPDGILVRVSAAYTNQARVDAVLTQFVRDLSASLKPDAHKLVFGS